MDAFKKLQREKFLRETVIPLAVQSFHEIRKLHPDADPYDIARNAGMAALAAHSSSMNIRDETDGRRLVQSYMRMCEAEFAVEIQNLQKPTVEAIH